jgi:hypothetical protein
MRSLTIRMPLENRDVILRFSHLAAKYSANQTGPVHRPTEGSALASGDFERVILGNITARAHFGARHV